MSHDPPRPELFVPWPGPIPNTIKLRDFKEKYAANPKIFSYYGLACFDF